MSALRTSVLERCRSRCAGWWCGTEFFADATALLAHLAVHQRRALEQALPGLRAAATAGQARRGGEVGTPEATLQDLRRKTEL